MSSTSRVFRQDDVTGTDFSALAIACGDGNTTGDPDQPLLSRGNVRRPVRGLLWLLNEHNSAARERAGYQEWGNTVYNTCQGPLQLDILKPRGSIVPRVNPQVSHVITSDRICLSHSASLQSGGSGPSRREVYAIFEDYGAVGEWSATRKLSKNGVVGARSEGRWELSGFPTLTQWRKGCRKKRSASRAGSRRTAWVQNGGAGPPMAGRLAATNRSAAPGRIRPVSG